MVCQYQTFLIQFLPARLKPKLTRFAGAIRTEENFSSGPVRATWGAWLSGSSLSSTHRSSYSHSLRICRRAFLRIYGQQDFAVVSGGPLWRSVLSRLQATQGVAVIMMDSFVYSHFSVSLHIPWLPGWRERSGRLSSGVSSMLPLSIEAVVREPLPVWGFLFAAGIALFSDFPVFLQSRY